MRRSLIVANWKMNCTISEARDLVSSLKPALTKVKGVDVVICPPFIPLGIVAEILDGTDIEVGAQDMYWEENGAYTGEVSPGMVAEVCQYVIVGHSERRQLFGDNDDRVCKKVLAAQQFGLTPIICVGESLDQRDSGCAEQVIEGQLLAAISGSDPTHKVVLAYEPIWAIGTGRAASSNDADLMMNHIRNVAHTHWGSVGSDMPILYGGSVTHDNVRDYVNCPNIDGVLVGGASLNTDKFHALVQSVAGIT